MSEIEDIAKLLESQDFALFIGRQESVFFEAKGSSPYDFTTAMGRFELAKDVSSFANSDGGFIVIGLTTGHVPSGDVDEVLALDLVAEPDFNVGKFAGLIADYVHPRIDGIDIRWVPSLGKPLAGVGVIEIPPQQDAVRPFLLSQVDPAKGKKREIVFGIATRSGAHSEPLTAAKLHRAVQKGSDEVSTRLSALETQVSIVLEKLDAAAEPDKSGSANAAALQPDVTMRLVSRIERAMGVV